MDPYCLPLRPHALTTPERARVLGPGLAAVNDLSLIMAINSVSAAAARYVGRPLHQILVKEEDPEFLRGQGRSILQLRAYPVVAIESVTVDGQAVEDFSQASQWLKRGQLYRESGWPWSVPRHCDLTGDPDFARARFNVAVAYRGGYISPAQDLEDGEPLPDEIELVMLREIGDLLSGARNTGRIRREKTAGGYEVEFAMSAVVSLSRETQDVLSGYVLGGCW